MNSTTLPIADRWFDRRVVDDSITLLWEPHVIELMRCNIWHVRGRDRDLIIDTGMGVVSLVDELGALIDRPVSAVATHGHDDHIGNHFEFDDCLAHPLEADSLRNPPLRSLVPLAAWGAEALASIAAAGYVMDAPFFVEALPAGFQLDAFRHYPAKSVRSINEGDIVDLGDRAFEVLHLPGHSPGSIGLWESATGTLFSGDALYDGPLLDELEDSNIDDYIATMERLLTLPVTVVHAGHDPSFGRDRHVELVTTYLTRRRP